MYNADIKFFHALVALGLSPYQAERATRWSSRSYPWQSHSRRLYCGLVWSSMPGKYEDYLTAAQRLEDAGQ